MLELMSLFISYFDDIKNCLVFCHESASQSLHMLHSFETGENGIDF
jgi:hypothetical protein